MTSILLHTGEPCVAPAPCPGCTHLRDLLRRIQWGGWSAGWRACPGCDAIEPHGHRDDCEIAGAIGEEGDHGLP